ncbi:MAG: glycerol-3-phosphate 1-O-acyltransferase PlsY [Phycisphaerales bacterium]|nr:glycerol-3-phosphate 1-O-acyltransferase PlsY [Phycisphaerales bacterium]
MPTDARWLLALLAIAYFVGSIPVGPLLARARGVDIRKHGSGNIGATNVWRVMGWRVGATCFGLDVLKGLVPAVMATAFATRGFTSTPEPTLKTLDSAMLNLGPLAVGGAAVVGHIFPVWLGFRGGKGVATGFGALAGCYPIMTIAMIGAVTIWLVCLRLTRMVGVSSVVAAVMAPVLTLVAPALAIRWRMFPGDEVRPGTKMGLGDGVLDWHYVVLTAILAGVIIYRHRANIARALAGKEPKISAFSRLRLPLGRAKVNGNKPGA